MTAVVGITEIMRSEYLRQLFEATELHSREIKRLRSKANRWWTSGRKAEYMERAEKIALFYAALSVAMSSLASGKTLDHFIPPDHPWSKQWMEVLHDMAEKFGRMSTEIAEVGHVEGSQNVEKAMFGRHLQSAIRTGIASLEGRLIVNP
jgi:hypothetical protein